MLPNIDRRVFCSPRRGTCRSCPYFAQNRQRLTRIMSTVTLAYCCSVCDEAYPTERRCQQHCSQPHSACNRGRAPHEFATPVPIRVRIAVEGNHRGRIVGGQVTRFQDGRGGRCGNGGRPTQEICGGPARMLLKAQPGTWTTTRSRTGKVPS